MDLFPRRCRCVRRVESRDHRGDWRFNHWIRTAKEFDGFFDFDKALQDPAHPTRLKPEYDSGDHLHPSDAGEKAMSEAIDLSRFK